MTTKTVSSKLVKHWDKVMQMIPNYDPTANPGACLFDYDAAQDAVDFFTDHLVFIEGHTAGQPFKLEPWQQAIVGNLFGWKRPDGTRRYRTAFVFVPRKSGKTPLVAGIINYVAFADGEPGAQIYSAAGEKEQAALVFRHAAGMIQRNPALESKSRVYRTFKSIEFYGGTCFYKAISADAKTKHGFNAHCVVVDELHVQRDRELVDTLITSTASRLQPLIIHITTAGYDKHTICYEIYDQAKRVMANDGADDSEFLPVIYEAEETDDWTDEKVWRKANPNLGVSVSLDYLRKACEHAKRVPAYENTFKRLHLDLWTEQENRWLPMADWDAAPKIKITEEMLAGRPCIAGLDLSSRKDITALVLLFPLDDGTFYLQPHFWIPKDNAVSRSHADRVPYLTWQKQGFLNLTEGNVIDYNRVGETLLNVMSIYDVQRIAFDRVFFDGIKQILDGQGVPVDRLVEFGQGYLSMSGPTKEFEAMVLSKRVIHNDHPVLRWMAANAAIDMDAAGNIKPSKKLAREKIDGIVASIMAMGLHLTLEPNRPSVYETRGILEL